MKRQRKKLDYHYELSLIDKPKKNKDHYQATWQNTQGQICKTIIDPNRCFCGHNFEQHDISNLNTPYCQVIGCKCRFYEYVPYYDIKCMCRHSYKDHDRNSKKCKMCKKCLGFLTNWSCKCGFAFSQHQNVIKVKKNRDSHKILTPRNMSHEKENTFQSQRKTCSPEKHSQKQSLHKNYHHYEENKFTEQLEIHHHHEEENSKNRKKLLDRLNSKFSTLSLEKSMEKPEENKSFILGSAPGEARQVTPLQLYLKPHNYRGVKISNVNQKAYDEYYSINKVRI